MAAACRVSVVLFALALVAVMCAPLCAQASSSPPAAEQVAKLPSESAASAPTTDAQPAAPSAPDAGSAPASDISPSEAPAQTAPTPAAKPVQVAVIPADLVGDQRAAYLIQLGQDYLSSDQPERGYACFQQAADLAPGSRESGLSLVLMAQAYASEGRLDDMRSVVAQVLDAYGDPEVRAFASLLEQTETLLAGNDAKAAVQLCADAASSWQGTALGAWAGKRIGDIYREKLEDCEAARNAYQRVAEAYPGQMAAWEAQLAAADALVWPGGRGDEAMESYQQLLDANPPTSIRLRALSEVVHRLLDAGDYTECWRVTSEVIALYPDNPATAWHHLFRADAGGKLGDRSMVAADAQAFLDAGIHDPIWVPLARLMLAQDAFLGGRLAEAEAIYTEIVETDWYEGQERALAGLAGCQRARGDLRGAAHFYQLAAEESMPGAANRCLYLYQAATAAQAAGDPATANQVINQMVAEFPGSYLTTRLVGHEILPTPEL